MTDIHEKIYDKASKREKVVVDPKARKGQGSGGTAPAKDKKKKDG